jgi:hypothetical protein
MKVQEILAAIAEDIICNFRSSFSFSPLDCTDIEAELCIAMLKGFG